MFAHPCLGGHLGGVPGRAEWRGVGQVEFAEAVDGHLVEEGGGVGVDAFGDFGAAVADELGAEETTGVLVAGDADVDRGGAGVVGLVVVGARLAGDWCPAEVRGEGFVVAQAGAGGDEVEDLDDLGAEAAGEAGVAAERRSRRRRGLVCVRWCPAAAR